MEAPQSQAALPAEEPKGSTVRIIEELYAKRHEIKTLVIGSIDDKNAADVAWSVPMNVLGLAHLLRMLNVKLDRHYQRGMYPPASPPGPVAGVKSNVAAANVSRSVRRQIRKAQKKVHKAEVRAADKAERATAIIKGNGRG